MTRIIGYCVAMLFSQLAWALVPVEGLILGQAQNAYQQDPLNFIFRNTYDTSQVAEVKKIRLYQNAYQKGVNLGESCKAFGPSRYSTPWKETQAKRSAVASLQYLGLDSSIKAIGALAKKLDVGEEDYQKLTKNLMRNFCSQNVTVYSLKKIEQSLNFYYQNPLLMLLPSVESSPFATAMFKSKTMGHEADANAFDYAIKNFKAFCSWGGDVSDYRMLAPYLSNSFIMSFLIQSMSGFEDRFDEKSRKISPVVSEKPIQVVCTDLICRQATPTYFKQHFPLSVGSTGVYTDLARLYCHHFRFQNYHLEGTIPEVRGWMKETELEGPILETSFFISLMTGVPELMLGVESYQEVAFVAKSSMDERWNAWARDIISLFSEDLLFEESLKVRAGPRKSGVALRTGGFHLDFTVTLGEMDRIMDQTDKLGLSFDLKFSKNYLHALRSKWNTLSENIDDEGQKDFKQEIARTIDVQLKEKEKLFLQKMWNQDFSRLLAEELVAQALTYEGPLFDSYQDKMLVVPVKFSYGLFALSYLRYRADVNAGRIKLNL